MVDKKEDKKIETKPAKSDKSNEQKQFIQKIIKIQSELKAPKSQYNSFAKFNYRSCEDILEAVKPLCAKYGLLLTIKDDIILIGTRTYVKSTCSITDSLNSISVTAYAREAETKKGMDDAQISGACSSYSKKYCLGNLFLIDDTKDGDSYDNSKGEYINDKQKNELLDLLADLGGEDVVDRFCNKFKVKNIDFIPITSFANAKAIIENQKKQREAK